MWLGGVIRDLFMENVNGFFSIVVGCFGFCSIQRNVSRFFWPVCVCVCECACVYICAGVCVYVYVYVRVCVCVCEYVCIANY